MEIILSLSCSSQNNWGNRRVDLRIRFLNEVRRGSDHVCWAMLPLLLNTRFWSWRDCLFWARLHHASTQPCCCEQRESSSSLSSYVTSYWVRVELGWPIRSTLVSVWISGGRDARNIRGWFLFSKGGLCCPLKPINCDSPNVKRGSNVK